MKPGNCLKIKISWLLLNLYITHIYTDSSKLTVATRNRQLAIKVWLKIVAVVMPNFVAILMPQTNDIWNMEVFNLEVDLFKDRFSRWREVTLHNCAIIGGVVSNSLLLSAQAQAVEAIHGVMPPVLFQGFSWVSIDHVASWALCYTCFVPWWCPPQISAKYTMLFFYTLQKSAKQFSRNGLRIQLLH